MIKADDVRKRITTLKRGKRIFLKHVGEDILIESMYNWKIKELELLLRKAE